MGFRCGFESMGLCVRFSVKKHYASTGSLPSAPEDPGNGNGNGRPGPDLGMFGIGTTGTYDGMSSSSATGETMLGITFNPSA